MAAKRMVRVLTSLAADKPEFKPFVDMKAGTEKGHGVLKAYKGPRLRIWEIDVEGPHGTWQLLVISRCVDLDLVSSL